MTDRFVETPFGWVDSGLVDEYWAATDLHEAAAEATTDAWIVLCELTQAGDVGGAALAKEFHAKARDEEEQLWDRVTDVVERMVYHSVPNFGTEGVGR